MEFFGKHFVPILERYYKIGALLSQTKIFEKENEQFKNIIDLYSNLTSKVLNLDPTKIIEIQYSFWNSQIKIIENIYSKFSEKNKVDDLFKSDPRDYRFKNQNWNDHYFFNYIKQTYLHFAEWLKSSTLNLGIEDKKTLRKINFLISQFIDATSPSNFIISNPEIINETIRTEGENLIKGLDNFISDLERSKEKFRISTTKKNPAFKIGDNLATTKGKVVFKNELIELIHYDSKTSEQYSIPLLIIPPCINKYYILDLQSHNSFVKWLIEKKINIYLISWKNPSENDENLSFEDYMIKGPFAALEFISKIHKKVNSLGYCIGGTILACTLSYLKKIGKNYVNNATFLTTLLDFREVGELSFFIDDLDTSKEENKIFSGESMSHVFNLLKTNEMIWSYYINNYLLGKEPVDFDILYWNNDSTSLPAKMHNFYIKNIYQDNALSRKRMQLLGYQIDLSDITQKCYFLSCKEDHIAPWRSTFLANKLIKSDITFVLAGSGHIAGVINPPAKNKYGYWTNENKKVNSSKRWLNTATSHQGSWWEHWYQWLSNDSGKQEVQSVKYKVIAEAPGEYVLE